MFDADLGSVERLEDADNILRVRHIRGGVRHRPFKEQPGGTCCLRARREAGEQAAAQVELLAAGDGTAPESSEHGAPAL
ncbi:MAG TPA: hypothetical protein VED41_00045 [Solirubrobacteraceae bacterium]|nr:hypothetical protein [Solirubrobacteraceae bacterium]